MTPRRSRRVGMEVNRPIPPGKLRNLVREFRENLHLPDPAPLYVVVGTIAGNLLPGVPVWTMMIGSPSCGKTELLLAVEHVRKVHLEGRLTGEAALLSGTNRKDVRAGATGGVLRQIGSQGIFLLKDFTSILTMQPDDMRNLLGAFVELYDGRWSRDIGADGGRKLEWPGGGAVGKLGFLTGCVPAVDRHHGVMADLGPRFLFFRYPEAEGYAESRTALTRVGFEQVRKELCEAMTEFFEEMETEELPPTPEGSVDRMIALATLSSRARSPVHRHPYTREVEDVPSWEMPPRLSQELAQLNAGMTVAGVGEEERWRILGKMAVDGVPSVRRIVLLTLCRMQQEQDRGGLGLGLRELVKETKCSSQTTRRALEDLELHGVVGEGKRGKEDVWYLSEWTVERWKEAFPGGYEGMLGERWGK
jgi:hypothetical protein